MNQNDIKEIIEKSDKYTMKTYGRYPIAWDYGKGSRLYSTEGKEYIDFLSGIAVVNLGYSNEKFIETLKSQAEKIIQTSNFFQIPSQVSLAELLVKNSFADKCFFGNSGAEVNEGAVKLARRRAFEKYGDLGKHEVISMTSAFHGRTMATLAITDSPKYKIGFGPIPQGYQFTPFNDIGALEEKVNDKTAAIIMEPVQGEGGVHPADQGFLERARELADEYDAALIFDEIQCGIGRTGELFAYQHYGVEPDIMTLAKALGNGLPIGAILAKGDFANTFGPGDHGTTFGGNPLATAGALATIEEIIEKDISSLASQRGAYLEARLKDLKNRYDFILDVRGKGLLLGMELDFEGGEVVNKMLEEGFIINCTKDFVLRFIPPLVITEEEIDLMVDALDKILEEYK